MSTNFLRIGSFDPVPLALELQRHPELWNQHPARLSPKGPHYQTDDIWLRYKDQTENVASGDWSDFADLHVPVWYPAIQVLPSARKLLFDLMARVEGEWLGGVLIYRVPPGKEILPHTDRGWHPEYFDKFNFAIQSQKGCSFYYPQHGEAMQSVTGDVHWFRNTVPHGVKNDSDDDQIILTVCVKAGG